MQKASEKKNRVLVCDINMTEKEQSLLEEVKSL